MAIFNSYVKLPEGNGIFMGIAWAYHALIMFNNDECGTANHKLPFGDGL